MAATIKPKAAVTAESGGGDLSAADIESCARWLREAWSGLESRDGILFEKRVHYFLGVELVDRLCSLSPVAAVVTARQRVRDARVAESERLATERMRRHMEAVEAARKKKKDPATMNDKEKEQEKRRAERIKRIAAEREAETDKRKAKRASIDVAAKKKKTYKNRAVEQFLQTEKDAILLAGMMMRAGYFHRSQEAAAPRPVSDDDDTYEDVRLEMHRQQKTFDEDGVYTWLIYPSQRTLWVQSALLAIFVVFCCCIKVWPLWLKVLIWWLSVILLIIMGGILTIRLVLYAVMWIVGFRGLWLFPNIMNDDLDFLDAFSPLFGRGITGRYSKHAVGAAAMAAEEESDGYFQFGAANVVVIGVLGLLFCNELGLFQGENIPEFVISQNDLWKNYGHLLAAPMNATEVAAAAARATAAEAAAEAAAKANAGGADAAEPAAAYKRDDSIPTPADPAEDVPLHDE